MSAQAQIHDTRFPAPTFGGLRRRKGGEVKG